MKKDNIKVIVKLQRAYDGWHYTQCIPEDIPVRLNQYANKLLSDFENDTTFIHSKPERSIFEIKLTLQYLNHGKITCRYDYSFSKDCPSAILNEGMAAYAELNRQMRGI